MDLETMEAEVLQYCKDMGWYEEEVPFEQAMALLHEEAAEAGAAWRKHGLEDMTAERGPAIVDGADPGQKPGLYVKGYGLPKPEGVGSEFADILIRALDDSTRYNLGLADLIVSRGGRFGLREEFLSNINILHGLIARASMAWDAQPDHFYQPGPCVADVVRFTMQLAEHYGIDLAAEYARKMAYNRTREYRHGGKRA
jgi:NTP pyrophosphatase (non-canonical NTP hydrolase)